MRSPLLGRLWRRGDPTTSLPGPVVRHPNTIFSRIQAQELTPWLEQLMADDPAVAKRLRDPRIAGLRTWEYGLLLAALADLDRRACERVLDVGAGDSGFARHLVDAGAARTVTTLDLPDPQEPRTRESVERDRRSGVISVDGSMLDLPFDDASFDLVLTISAIEHLDGSPKQRRAGEQKASRARYLQDTRRALREMLRVVAPGGLFYCTTDAFDPARQRHDAWTHKFLADGAQPGPIWSAYHYEDIEDVFVAAVREAGLSLVGEPALQMALLEDGDRASYRGRYFTTFAILAQRPR